MPDAAISSDSFHYATCHAEADYWLMPLFAAIITMMIIIFRCRYDFFYAVASAITLIRRHFAISRQMMIAIIAAAIFAPEDADEMP
jgi:hypothetical protein